MELRRLLGCTRRAEVINASLSVVTIEGTPKIEGQESTKHLAIDSVGVPR